MMTRQEMMQLLCERLDATPLGSAGWSADDVAVVAVLRSLEDRTGETAQRCYMRLAYKPAASVSELMRGMDELESAGADLRVLAG